MKTLKTIIFTLMCILIFVGAAEANEEIFSYGFGGDESKLNGFTACGFKDGINSFYVKENIGGKENGDNAVCINVNEYKNEFAGNYSVSKPFLLKNISENITESFVAEGSIFSAEDKADSYIAMNINGIYTKIFELKSNGFVSLGGTESILWQKGRWYHFAMEFDFSSLKADFYINGELILSNAPIRGANGDVAYFGGMKLCCDCEVYGKQNFPVKNESAFDNVSVYKGRYVNRSVVNIGQLIKDNGFLLIDKTKSASSFLEEAGNIHIKIYTDSSFETVSDVAADGYIVVAFSDDKKSIEYFTVADTALETDYKIKGESILIPEKTTVHLAKKGISTPKGTIVAFLDEKGKLLKNDDLIYDGGTLVLQNKSGYVRKYSVSGEAEVNKLSSAVYTVSENVISNIPKDTNSSYFINSLSADNPKFKIRLLKDGIPVRNETVTENMVITAEKNNVHKTYGIKIGFSRSFFENFESVNGRFVQNDTWKMVDNFSKGVFFEAFNESDSNKALRMNTVSGINNYFRTGLFDYSDGIEIAFDFKINSQQYSQFALMMYDSAQNANYIYLANISNSEKRVKFFVGKKYAVADGLADGWHSIKVKICADKKVYVFCDDVKISELDDYLSLSDGAKFDLSNGGVIFKATGDGEFLIDNITISDKVSLENAEIPQGFFAYDTEMYIKDKNGIFFPSESIEKGEITVATGLWNNTDEDKNVNVITALTDENSIKDIFSVSNLSISPGVNKRVDIPIYIENINDNTELRTFVWGDIETLAPIREQSIIKQMGIRIPAKTALENLFEEKCNGIHPRILARENDFEKIREYVLYDENISEWNEYVISRANVICENLTNNEEDASSPYYIAYTSAFNSGNQILEISRRVKNFIIDLGMAYQLTNDSKYSDSVWKIIQYVGLRGTDMSPWGFPDWNEKSSVLDAAEMAGGVAIGYDWCFDAFSESQKKYIRDSIYKYGIAKFKNVREIYNSNIVYNSCMIMAALSIADIAEYKEASMNVIHNSLKNIQYSLANWNFDGAWEEGSMYAVYTSEYLAKLICTLYSSMETDFGISNSGGIEEILDYMIYIDGPTATNNYNDSSAKTHIKDASLLYFASLYNKPEYMKELLFRRKTYSYCMGALEMLWYSPGSDFGNFSLNGSKYMEGNEVITLQNADFSDTNRGWLSLQGGFSKNSHGHYDTGSFVYDSDNIRWIYDLGQENYTVFHESGEGREKFYRARPEGHNVYVINPDAESIGQNAQAYSEITDFSDSDDVKFAVLDMSQCYSDNADKAVRGYRLTENGKVMFIKDEISLITPQSTVYWFLHFGDNVTVTQLDENTVLLKKENIEKVLKVDCNYAFKLSVVKARPLTEIDDEFVCENYPDPESQNQNANISKIMVKICGADENLEIGAALMPCGYKSVQLLEKISEWK